MTLDEIKLYLRVDSSEDDALIGDLQAAAASYLQATTGKTYDKNNTLHNLLVKQLIAFWYENRGSSEVHEIPYTITALTNQIGLASESDVP